MSYIKGQNDKNSIRQESHVTQYDVDFVLEKEVFSSVFQKDIKRVYFYKKGERLAKAIHWILPAFSQNPSLSARLNALSIALVDASLLTPREAREALTRELLTLRSLLSLGETSGALSSMNASLIIRECENFIREVGLYDDPRLVLPPSESIAEVARGSTLAKDRASAKQINLGPNLFLKPKGNEASYKRQVPNKKIYKGHKINRESILDILRSKGRVFIKDLSTVIRNVSEKTIQRELLSMVDEGLVLREGERRWTSYSLNAPSARGQADP